MEIFKEFTFEAAHRLPNMPEGHPCGRLHGHSWKAVIHLDASVDTKYGWVMDFGDISKKFQPLHDQLDHNYLNDIEGLENPTAENIAKWIWDRLKKDLPELSKVSVYETVDTCAIYSA